MNSELPAILGGEPVNPEGVPDWPLPRADVAASVNRALASGAWGRYHGPNCDELSRRLAALHGGMHVELCASGTAAVELALAALKVGPGAEVILAAYDFRGNMANVLARGATPVLVDVDPVTGQMDATKVNAALTNKTAAVTVSHLHGGMADVAAVKEAIGASGAKLIEDICQMPGAQWNGEIAGTNADVVVWSFGGSKLLTAALQAEGFPAFAGFRSLHRSFARSRFQAAGELSQATRLHERCVVLHHTVLYGDEARAEKLAAALAKIEAHAVRIAAEVASPLSEREGGA